MHTIIQPFKFDISEVMVNDNVYIIKKTRKSRFMWVFNVAFFGVVNLILYSHPPTFMNVLLFLLFIYSLSNLFIAKQTKLCKGLLETSFYVCGLLIYSRTLHLTNKSLFFRDKIGGSEADLPWYSVKVVNDIGKKEKICNFWKRENAGFLIDLGNSLRI